MYNAAVFVSHHHNVTKAYKISHFMTNPIIYLLISEKILNNLKRLLGVFSMIFFFI